jgi:hypothetical protein
MINRGGTIVQVYTYLFYVNYLKPSCLYYNLFMQTTIVLNKMAFCSSLVGEIKYGVGIYLYVFSELVPS